MITAYLTESQIRGHRPHTIELRRSVLTALQLALDGTPILEATTDDLTRWMLSHQHYSPNTRSTYARCAAAFYAWAVQRGHIERSPMTAAPMPRQPKSRPRPIPDDELREAIDAADGDLRAWLILGAFAGLRAGEIARLRREHVVNGSIPYVEVINGKGGRDRRVPVGQIVLDAVSGFGKPRGAMWKITPKALSMRVARHFRSLDMPYTCHQMRHSYASRLFRVSHDLRLVQEALGHASPATTAIYSEPDHAGAVRALADLQLGFAA